MTIGCEDSDSKFSPCADCSFEYQPKGCREYRTKGSTKAVCKSSDWDKC